MRKMRLFAGNGGELAADRALCGFGKKKTKYGSEAIVEREAIPHDMTAGREIRIE